ncbi:hypothetical protein EDD15DRAFT_2202622 [Pisolithus albus]|nr:hypothetical protein EDD15DRAFT_2202622 [Pisolithus albus]
MAVPVASQSAWPPSANTAVMPQNPFTPVAQFTNPFLTPPQHPVQYRQQPVSPGVRTYTFKHVAQTIIREAIQITNEGPVPGPGSEYASVAVPMGHGEVNLTTRLRKTKNNLSGTACTTPICLGRKRVDHDWSNCYQPGGGKAGQAPWQRGKSTTNNTSTAAVVTPTPAPVAPVTLQPVAAQAGAPIAAAAIQYPPADDYFRNLSSAAVEELSEGETSGKLLCLATTNSSTILDSGTTIHLIKDPSFFWTFTHGKPRQPEH